MQRGKSRARSGEVSATLRAKPAAEEEDQDVGARDISGRDASFSGRSTIPFSTRTMYTVLDEEDDRGAEKIVPRKKTVHFRLDRNVLYEPGWA